MHLCMQVKFGTAAAESSDEEEDYQELPSPPASDARSDGSDADSDLQDGPDGVKDAAVVDEGVSDLDYLKSRMRAGVGARGADKDTSSQTSSLTDTGQGAHEASVGSLVGNTEPKLDLLSSAGRNITVILAVLDYARRS